MDYGYILEPGPGGGWFAYAPDLPGCTGFGKTEKRASRNLAGAVRVYLGELKKEGKPPPEPSVRVEAYPETEAGFRTVQPGETLTANR